MNAIVILFLAGLTALAFVIVSLRNPRMTKPLRGILLLVAAAIAAYIGWIFISGMK